MSDEATSTEPPGNADAGDDTDVRPAEAESGDAGDDSETGARLDADEDDDSDEDSDEDDDYDDASCAERVLDVCVRAIVDAGDEVDIDAIETNRRVTLHVRVAPEDMGKVIGKRGRVANVLRTLVKAAGARDGVSAQVEIED